MIPKHKILIKERRLRVTGADATFPNVIYQFGFTESNPGMQVLERMKHDLFKVDNIFGGRISLETRYVTQSGIL